MYNIYMRICYRRIFRITTIKISVGNNNFNNANKTIATLVFYKGA